MSNIYPNLSESNQKNNLNSSSKLSNHNMQNNNMPLSFFENNSQNMTENKNNYIIFGEQGVENTFILPNEKNTININNKYNNMQQNSQNDPNINNATEQKRKDVNFKYIKQSLEKKSNNEKDKKLNTVLKSSKKNNKQENQLTDSKRANEPNPFYKKNHSTIPPKNGSNQNNNSLRQSLKIANNQNEQNNNIIMFNNDTPNQKKTNSSNNIDNNQIINNYHNKNHLQQNRNQIHKKNEYQNQNQQNQENYSFSRYKKAALTGLKNLGNTSYLNSVLQLICCIKSFASYFLNPKNGEFFKNNINDYRLSYVIHRLCFHLYPFPERDMREIYTPDSLLQILGEYNRVYGDNKEKDPNELIVFILDKLHEELNSIKNKNEAKININNIISDRNAIINQGLNIFQKNNYSIISNIFTWFEIKEIKCKKCHKDFYYFQYFPTLELNVLDCAKSKKIQNIKIEDCLDFLTMVFEKKGFCEFCKNYYEVYSCSKIYSSPNFFLFLLDLREDNNIKLIIEQNINLQKYIENKFSPKNYELNGIVFFDLIKKKYNTFCISPVDKKWYLYDDDKVKLVDYNNFMNLIDKDINKMYKPHILLYKGIM